MSRIRTIKPDFFRHEGLFELEQETGFPIRVAFAGLFGCCDREGRFRWRPRQLKLDVLPYDDLDFSRVLDALLTRGFLVRYEIAGEAYGLIPSFLKHQQINPRESASKIPPPLGFSQDEPSEPTESGSDDDEHSRVNDASPTRQVLARGEKEEEGNKEGKRKGINTAQSRVTNSGADLSELPEQLAADLLALRKAKRAPLTQTAWDALKTQYAKAGLSVEDGVRLQVGNGWQGFEADWIKRGQGQGHGGASSGRAVGRNESAVAEAIRRNEERLRAQRPGSQGQILEGEFHELQH